MEQEIGKISHYFNKAEVAVVKVKEKISVGDQIKIKRKNGKEFEQTVESMQVEHQQVQEAKKGDEVGMKVDKPVKEGDLVYKA